MSCIFFTGGAEVAETVYFLPKDNVDIAKNPDRDYLIVGFSQPIPEEYIEALQPDLVYLPNYVDGDTMAVEKAAYLAFTRLQWDLRNKYGINVALYDGYRTVADQQWLIESGLATYTTGQPGYSEHHTGLLLDIIVEVGEYYYSELAVLTDESVPEEVKSSTAFNTLHEILPDYGFIIRYPKGKESYTGIAYNPSEIRFVGSKEVAHAIMDNNLCLEEYISTLTP
ncbi:D-alanyl-D-alanine carboxypeptidase family protein [Candidatus Saccharibacteria bacterium]|nr:D-alanyl-D-alanine carboxypeptidase family protein [Candidatus Saccharibacteria bacterium]